MTFRHAMLAATILALPALLPGAANAAEPIKGLYLSGAMGGNFMQSEKVAVNNLGISGNVNPNSGFVGLVAVGWGFGNGLRAELEGNYRYNSLPGFSTDTAGSGGYEQKMGGMVNAYYDFNNVAPWIVPYLGAGVGYVGVNLSNVHAYSVVSTDLGDVLANASVSNSTKGSFAGQAIVGAAFPITPAFAITTEYRFFALAGDRTYTSTVTDSLGDSATGSTKWTNNFNHSLLLGVRYAFGMTPPPVPIVAPAPAPAPARSYLVFFDWDKYNLTDRAKQIIADAAANSKKVTYTKIESNGYTDTSGSAAYNKGLSVRRAQAVAAQLVADGVPKEAIVITGFGETNPLVPTGPNVREPQNRRVEIIIK